MPAMFTTIALTASRRGQNLDELAQATGRRKSDLKEAIRRLKAAGIVKETDAGAYKLTTEFARHYERALDLSGVTYAERKQKRDHADDRVRRDSKLGTDEQEGKLRGKEHMQSITNRKIHAARVKWRESERQREKVGVSVAAFLDDEIDGKYGARIGDTIERWKLLHKGEAREIFAAIQYGPFVKRRVAGDLYVYHDPR
jgi:hypothetical protein